MQKITIGITGILGVGKSTVCNIFKNYGVEIIDSDKIVKNLLKNNTIKNKIIKEFGDGIIKRKGIDKKKLAKLVFSSKKNVLKINKIIHPKVISIIKSKIKNTHKKIIVAEVPLLFESKISFFDYIITIKCPKKIIIKRLVKKGWNKKEILRRWKYQLSQKEKIKRADFVINNSKSINNIRKQVKEIIEIIKKM